MITMKPALLSGRSVWDQSLLPRQEFDERLDAVRSLMLEQRIDALLIFGDYADYANICYLTQFIPMRSWAMAIIPSKGEVMIVSGAGVDRNIPFIRSTTWVEDIRCLRNLGSEIRSVLLEKCPDCKRLGIVGFDDMVPVGNRAVVLNAVSDFDVRQADRLLSTVRSKTRPRERTAIAQAGSIVSLAKQKMTEVFTGGGSVQAAAIESELTARKLGAQDVRILIGTGGSLWPLEDIPAAAKGRLTAYIAVEFQGFWADAAVTIPASNSSAARKAGSALQAMINEVKSGVTSGSVADKALLELGPELGVVASEFGLGNGIGLSLEQSPVIRRNGDDRLAEGSVLSLRVCVPDGETPVLLSDVVVVGETGSSSIFSK